MKVDLLDRNMVDSDLGVVNAARCSFDKESKELTQKDITLIRYLAYHNHWTPFGHPQEVFQLDLTLEEEHRFLYNANLSGFEWCKTQLPFMIRGSLYAWLTNLQYLPLKTRVIIHHYLQERYPVSTSVLSTVLVGTLQSESISLESNYDELVPITLRIHVPIIIKRQLETHRRNFVMTDMEDFSQNEVSRRYVSSEPELFIPKEWRKQSETKKQGSSDEKLDFEDAYLTNADYYSIIHNAAFYYREMIKRDIAAEQARLILPVATYTTFWWTGSLKSWNRLLTLRLQSDVQKETHHVARLIEKAIYPENKNLDTLSETL